MADGTSTLDLNLFAPSLFFIGTKSGTIVTECEVWTVCWRARVTLQAHLPLVSVLIKANHGCSLWDAFTGNVTICYVYKLHYSNVIVMMVLELTSNFSCSEKWQNNSIL